MIMNENVEVLSTPIKPLIKSWNSTRKDIIMIPDYKNLVNEYTSN